MSRSVVVTLSRPRAVTLLSEAPRQLGPDEVRIRTLLSGVSAGTELAYYRGTNPYLHKRWDADLRLFVPDAEFSVGYPITNWGYEEVGEVIEAGSATDIALGTRVYGTWGHRSEYVAPGAYASERSLPAGVPLEVGIFSHIGPIALNGVLDTAVRLGETVAVFGLGVVGQLVVQLLRLAGARVIAVELLAERRDIAARLGTAEFVDPTSSSAAEAIKALTDGRGADVCVEASGSTRALHEAIRACAYNARVVALGFYQGEAAGLALGEEFHHNRISLVCSQIGGIAPELQHRWDRARLVGTFMRVASEGAVHCRELITHRVPASEADSLYRLIDERPQAVLQAVLDFSSLDSG